MSRINLYIAVSALLILSVHNALLCNIANTPSVVIVLMI